MGEPSNRLFFGFHSILAVSGPPIWNLFGSDQKKYNFDISKLACLLEFKMRMKEIAITITLYRMKLETEVIIRFIYLLTQRFPILVTNL